MAFYEPVSNGSPISLSGSTRPIAPTGLPSTPIFMRNLSSWCWSRGSGRLYVDGVGYPIRAGEGAFINAQSIHLGQPDSREPVSFFALVFSPRIFGSSPGDLVTDKYVTPVVHRSLRLPLVCTPSIPWASPSVGNGQNLARLQRRGVRGGTGGQIPVVPSLGAVVRPWGTDQGGGRQLVPGCGK